MVEPDVPVGLVFSVQDFLNADFGSPSNPTGTSGSTSIMLSVATEIWPYSG
jgi:hypothetical protein